jgi:hypothetical protein
MRKNSLNAIGEFYSNKSVSFLIEKGAEIDAKENLVRGTLTQIIQI